MSIKPVTTVNSQPGLVVRDIDTNVATDLVADTHYLIVANAVIDEDGDWVPMVQPGTGTISGTFGTTEYLENRVEYDANGIAIYTGEHEQIDALESDMNWNIQKFEYDNYGNAVKSRTRTGSWTDRSIAWA